MENERVSIQYSIPLKDLPGEVRRLLGKINAEVGLLQELESWRDNCDVLSRSTFYSLDQLRHKLASIDRMCEDTSAIIQGYMKYQESPTQHQIDDDSIDENSD
jgi:hypothetical protein